MISSSVHVSSSESLTLCLSVSLILNRVCYQISASSQLEIFNMHDLAVEPYTFSVILPTLSKKLELHSGNQFLLKHWLNFFFFL